MSWLSVARKDFVDARRSKTLWGVGAVYVLFVALVVYVTGDRPPGYEVGMAEALHLVGAVGIFVVPITALVAAYLAVAGERESGSIKYLLGLPNTRADVVVGKLLGRTAVVTLGLLVAFAVALGIGAVRLDSLDTGVFVPFVLLTLYFALVYVAIAVGVSAACGSRSRAMGGAVGVFLVFNVLWTAPAVSVVRALRFVVEDTLGLSGSPELYEFVRHLSPSFAYQRATGLVFEDGPLLPLRLFRPDEPIPFYLEEWFMLVILGAWLVLPLVLGYLSFERTDLG